MPIETLIEKDILQYVDSRRDDLIDILQTLVRTPSENTPPTGAEAACQRFCEASLNSCGFTTDLYELGDIPGLADHPLFYPGRDYTGRPNLAARRAGSGGGRSLILSGHIDTVPRGTLPWTRDPFSAHIEDGRLYGRGSNDMKAGVAINLFIMEALEKMGLRLGGDVIFESVVDEEFGGVNGTLAGRVRGHNGDAAVIAEPSFLRVCPGHRGGRTVHITLTASGGIFEEGKFPSGVMDQLRHFLNSLKDFEEHRRKTAPEHELFGRSADPVPVSITKVHTSPWGTNEPITVPETCKIEMYWQLMPGETQEAVEREFFDWFNGTVDASPDLFTTKPEVTFPIRWLPGGMSPNPGPLVSGLRACAAKVLGSQPAIAGLDGPCDMYIFHQLGIPAVLWGPSGGNTHGADEYLDIDTAVAAAKALLLFVCDWCGIVS